MKAEFYRSINGVMRPFPARLVFWVAVVHGVVIGFALTRLWDCLVTVLL